MLLVIFVIFGFVSCHAQKDVYGVVGKSVVLQCESQDKWKRENLKIEVFNTTKVSFYGNNLEIKNLADEDFTTYSCDENSFRLLKGKLPVLTKGFEVKSELQGESITLECQASALPKLKTISWSFNGKTVTANSNMKVETLYGANDIVTGRLKIENATLQNNGNFTCSGSNDLPGSFSHTRKVNIYAQPAALSISVLNIHPNNVTLLLTRKDNLTSQEMLQRRIIISYSSNTGGLSKNITLNLTDEKSFEYNVEQLKPYTEYTFYVNERVATLDGKISNITVNTSEAAPLKPRKLVSLSRTSNSVKLAWEKPLHLNGKIREFKVIYYFYVDGIKNDKTLVTSNVTKREIKISELYPHVKYTFYVYEKTTEYGPYAEVSETTLESVPQAAPRNLRVEDETSNSVRFRWDPVPFYERGGEDFGYVIEYVNKDGSIPEKKVFPKAETTSVILNNLMPYTEYELSISGRNTEGSGKSAKFTFTTRASAPSAPRNVTGVAFKSSIKLTWMPPANMNGQPDLFQVVYRKVLSCAHVRCKREMPFGIDFAENGSLPLSGNRWHYIDRILDPYSLYSIDVRESTKNGGWGNYSSPGVDVLTNIASPTKPLNVSAVSVSDTSVTVTWEEPDMPNGRMISYKIVTYFGSSILKEDIYTLAQNIPYQLKFTVEGLKSESTYVVQIQGFNTHLGDPSDRLYVKTAAPAPSFPWLFVLIGCLATVLLIACMVTVFIFMSRRNSRNTMYKNVKTKEEIVVNNAQQAKAIHITDLKQYCSDHHANSDFLYHEEFESVVVPTSNYSFEHSRMPYNQSKNRYSNVLPYDHSRVTLNPIDNEVGSSYINANFIDGYKHNKKYIATQGPLPETVLDFWRMVWEQNVPIIVMLTKLVEDNRLKCEQYWPPGDGLQYKDIVVKVLSVSELTDYTIRIFQVYKFNNPSAGQRIIRQYHYTAWPDHGVPSHPTSMLSFVRHVMNYHEIGRLNIENAKALEGPIIVHCSAGVGRTGTFIAIEGCLKQIEEEQQVDVYGSVYRMRKQRNYMVQTEHQYTFIYDALLDSVICGNTEIAPADLVSKIRFLNERDPATGETNFAAEFKRLECGILQKDVKQFGEANHLENKQKNRFLNILPFDKNRVRLTPIAGIRHSDYINASVIDGFQQKNTFIASQAPLENTVNDFWRMIVERSVHIIVMLTKLEEKGQDKCYLYWPQASTVSYGKVLVGFIDSIEEESVVIHHLRVTDKETQRSWTVIHFNYLGWPEYGSPDNGTEIIHLIGRVQAAHRSIKSEAGPILVHCSGGVGRTGVFISVFNSIERLKAKDVVDIFQTTRALRLQRTAMVQTIDQYIFCYQALKDYLDSFDLYANTKC